MQYLAEFDDAYKFPAWSGGATTLNHITEMGKTVELARHLEEVLGYDGERIPTETEINDYLWFERDAIYEALGIED